MSELEYGPLFPNHLASAPVILGVTDLGGGNRGQISAADLSQDDRTRLIEDISSPKYHLRPTNCFRCVDGRPVEGGLQTLPGYADPQLAGGVAISETASGMLVVRKQLLPLSEQVANNTRLAIIGGVIVRVHGDNHKGKAGCGGNAEMRTSIGLTAEPGNHDLLVDKTWMLAQSLELHRLGVKKEDINAQLRNADRNVNDDSLWDTNPEENVDIAISNGAEYEKAIDDHTEKAILVSTSASAFDEEMFMHDHPAPNSTSWEVFVASLGVYTRWKLETAYKQGINPRSAALGILGVAIFNIAVPKVLTAEERGNGEALPVVIMGARDQ